MTKQQYGKLAAKAAILADSKKAENIVIYDISKNSSVFYYAVIVTVQSLPQIKAVEEELITALKKDGAYSEHRDGASSAKWRALDYGGFIVHIFEPETRLVYALDKLYSDCPVLKWKEDKTPKKAVKTKKIKNPAKKKIKSAAKKTPKKSKKKNGNKKA